MNPTKTLVVYFSRSGTTRTVGEFIARALQADLDEIRDTKDRSGLLGYVRCLLDVILSRPLTLEPPRCDPGFYDLVIVGTA